MKLINYRSNSRWNPGMIHPYDSSIWVTILSCVFLFTFTSLLFRVSQLNKLPDSIYSITRRPLGKQIPRKRTMFLWSNFPIIRNSFAKSVITASVRMFSFKLKMFVWNVFVWNVLGWKMFGTFWQRTSRAVFFSNLRVHKCKGQRHRNDLDLVFDGISYCYHKIVPHLRFRALLNWG